MNVASALTYFNGSPLSPSDSGEPFSSTTEGKSFKSFKSLDPNHSVAEGRVFLCANHYFRGQKPGHWP